MANRSAKNQKNNIGIDQLLDQADHLSNFAEHQKIAKEYLPRFDPLIDILRFTSIFNLKPGGTIKDVEVIIKSCNEFYSKLSLAVQNAKISQISERAGIYRSVKNIIISTKLMLAGKVNRDLVLAKVRSSKSEEAIVENIREFPVSFMKNLHGFIDTNRAKSDVMINHDCVGRKPNLVSSESVMSFKS